MKICHYKQKMLIREYHDLWSQRTPVVFVNSWGYSWMAIREFVGLFVDGYSWMAIREFVGLFVDGNSWVYSWMAISWGCFLGRREMGGYKTRAVRDPRRTRDGRVQDPRPTGSDLCSRLT